MASGFRYRSVSLVGTGALVAFSLWVANLELVQGWFAHVPYFGRPAPERLTTGEFTFAFGTTVVVVLASMWPLFKPRPRRLLDTVLLTQKRVVFAMVFLAALGYFNYSYRLPRSILMLLTGLLLVSLPLFTVYIRRRPRSSSSAVLIGDDPAAMADLRDASDQPIVGYISLPGAFDHEPDGSSDTVDLTGLSSLGGFARLEEVLVENDVDTALLAFRETDRAEFFGTLEICYSHGVTAKVHRDHADHVLTASPAGTDLLEVDLEPWDWQDYVVKRGFDVTFALTGLLVAAPLLLLIAIAIKLDSSGPVLYSQRRTAEFGETFHVFKFRSMVADAEATTGAKVSEEDAGGVDPRVTRVGRVLRETHLDELPQLWSILVGDMSVVGPRPERPELEGVMERGAGQWRRRWFVKPGLTGLAQVRGATGHDPETKLRHDIEYIRRQSFWFDLKILIRQLWQVWLDLLGVVINRDATGQDIERIEQSTESTSLNELDGGPHRETEE